MSMGRNLRNRAKMEHSHVVHRQAVEANENVEAYVASLSTQMERDMPGHGPVDISFDFKSGLASRGDPMNTARRKETFFAQICANGASADALRAFELKLAGTQPEGKMYSATSGGVEIFELHGSATSIIADLNTALDADLKLTRPTKARNGAGNQGRF